MSTTTPPPEDREPDDLLPEEADLRRHYAGLSRPEPGPALDARVRCMAGQALREDESDIAAARGEPARVTMERGQSRTIRQARGRRGSSGWRWPRTWWLAAAGSAAVAVLAVGLVRHQHIELPPAQAPVRADHAPAEKAAPRAPALAPAPPSSALSVTQVPALKLELASPSLRPAVLPPPALSGPVPSSPAPASKPALQALRPQAPKLSLRETPKLSLRAASSGPVRASRAQQHDDVQTKALQHIRDLFAQGKAGQALDLLEAFHKAHPQRQLPADLRARLLDTGS